MSGSVCFRISLSLCFIMTVMVSETIIAAHTDHDCTGESCPLCIMVQRAENFSRQFKHVTFHPGSSTASIILSTVVLNFAVFCPVPLSSVRLKVKMNR
jgi:hypothetical protein